MQRRNRPGSSPEPRRESSQGAAQPNRTLTESLPPIQAKAIAQLMAARQPRTPTATRPDPRDGDSEPVDPDPATGDERAATDDEPTEPDPAEPDPTEDTPGDPE